MAIKKFHWVLLPVQKEKVLLIKNRICFYFSHWINSFVQLQTPWDHYGISKLRHMPLSPFSVKGVRQQAVKWSGSLWESSVANVGEILDTRGTWGQQRNDFCAVLFRLSLFWALYLNASCCDTGPDLLSFSQPPCFLPYHLLVGRRFDSVQGISIKVWLEYVCKT